MGYENQRLVTAGIPVHFVSGEESVAELLGMAVRRAAELLERRWDLRAPPGLTVHVLSDWRRFVLASAPRGRRWLARLTMPLWAPRAARQFAAIGGWAIPWRGAPAVGVKGPDALQATSELSAELFETVADPEEKLAHVACHELTHAFTAHLRLPPWINEGVAMRAVDHLAGESTVRGGSKQQIQGDPGVFQTRGFRRAARQDPRRLLEIYATGYWATREVDASSEDALRSALSESVARSEREARFVQALRSIRSGESAS